jgi:hypothetical protein
VTGDVKGTIAPVSRNFWQPTPHIPHTTSLSIDDTSIDPASTVTMGLEDFEKELAQSKKKEDKKRDRSRSRDRHHRSKVCIDIEACMNKDANSVQG